MSLNLQESDLVKYLISVMGREAGIKTFGRWSRYIQTQFVDTQAEIAEHFTAIEEVNGEKTFSYNNLVSVLDIKCAMLCPHHLLPVEMVVNIGYIPNKKMLGLSKFARVAQAYAKPPKTQEEYTAGLAKLVAEGLQSEWVIVVVKGIHSCMRHRGVESRDSITFTNSIIGAKDESRKMEFLGVMNANRE